MCHLSQYIPSFLALSCLQTSQFLEDKILILRPIFVFLIPRLTNWQFGQVQSITAHNIRMRCWGLLSLKICLKIFQDLSQNLSKFRVSLFVNYIRMRWWGLLSFKMVVEPGNNIHFCIGLAKRKNMAFVFTFGQ